MFRSLYGHHQAFLSNHVVETSSPYSATALSVWPWLPLQLMSILLYPLLSFSIVSHQAALNRLFTSVWVILYLFFLLIFLQKSSLQTWYVVKTLRILLGSQLMFTKCEVISCLTTSPLPMPPNVLLWTSWSSVLGMAGV